MSGAVLTIGVLGPLEVTMGSRPVVVTSGRLRTLLVVLAMSAGRAVSVDRLAAVLWDEDPPDNSRRSVQTYVTRLRAVLGSESISTTPAGYVLRAEPDCVDALRLMRLLDAAAQTTDPATERARLAEALALWRGTPFDGVRSDWLAHTEATRLTERRLAAVERRIDLDLIDGRHAELSAELRQLTAQHPLREPLWVRLLVVLDRYGRQAEALERYETIRVRLADELGTDPGLELRQIHADLLAGTRPRRAEPVVAGRPVPHQLPADIDGFTGRDTALKALDDLISEGDERTANTVVISAIAGTAGIGKTALAVHWAHQVADRFPDGQLYVNLRGFDPSEQMMTPDEAVRGFLDALEVPPQRIPSDLDAQAALYRSLLTGKRMLVLLDNARDADQVRPLLPGSPGCLVLVTSRNQLTSLIATAAGQSLPLDLLPVDEARELLARRIGTERLAAEPRAADEIITLCARLPLALSIAAARATTRPGFPLHVLAADLRAAYSDLVTFTAGDRATDVRSVFSWSYHTLSADAARLFRLLSLHTGPDIAVPAVASLAGFAERLTQPLLAELTRAHLLTEHAPGRYTFHDLLRAYAAELSSDHDDDTERRNALHRLFDHYLHTAHAATLELQPHRDPVRLEPPHPGAIVYEVPGRHGAVTWFTAEYPVLLAAIGAAAGAEFRTHAWQIAWSLEEFLYRQGHWHDWKDTQHTALEAATRRGDHAGQAFAHRSLAGAYVYLRRLEDALTHLQEALSLFGQLDDLVGQARTLCNLSDVLGRQHAHAEALRHSLRALDLYVVAGHRPGQARALNAVGWDYGQLGNYQQALIYCQQAIALYQEIGDDPGEAPAWDSLGYAHYHLGNYEQAVVCYQRALDLFQDIDSRYLEAETLTSLGDAHAAAGDPAAACAAWQNALAILHELDHPDAEQVRAKLYNVDQSSTETR